MPVSRRMLRAWLAVGSALAGAGAWCLLPAAQPQVARQALSVRPGTPAATFARAHPPGPAAPALAAAADEPSELADEPAQAEPASRVAEDQNLGQPSRVPSGSAAGLRAPDPPPELPLDPDEVTADDPHDFDLPARAASPSP